ncbi:MAG: helix-turn-helix domain-containing protein [Candidatus Hodarchaeales archaeon]
MALKTNYQKDELLHHAKTEFLDAGYSLSDEKITSSSFDFIAKKPGSLSPEGPIKIITRVLAELDLFKKQASIELQLIAKLIRGKPLLIAQFATGKKVEDATLYRRHNVPAISLQTLQMFLKEFSLASNTFSITKYAQRGGIYVNLSKERFIERRKRLELDIQNLAGKIGISRQSLYKYERGICSPKVDSYQRIRKIMGDNLDHPLDFFIETSQKIETSSFKDICSPKSQLQKEVAGYLYEKDIEVLWFKSEPFDGLSLSETHDDNDKRIINPENTIITGVSSRDNEKEKNRIQLLNQLSHFLGKRAIWFVDAIPDKNTQNSKTSKFLTILSISELERMGNKEFLKLIHISEVNKSTKNPDLGKKSISKGN